MNCEIKNFDTNNYLLREYENTQNSLLTILGCTIEFIDNLHNWRIILIGPKNTPYADGIFILTVSFDIDYPYSKPEVRFVNKIYHLHVSPINGHISLPILSVWDQNISIVNVISNIFDSFYNQNPSFSNDSIMAKEYETDRSEFNRKAQEWTKKYASKNIRN